MQQEPPPPSIRYQYQSLAGYKLTPILKARMVTLTMMYRRDRTILTLGK